MPSSHRARLRLLLDPSPTEIGDSARLYCVMIGVTLSEPSFTTWAVLPSGVMAIDMGCEPTGIAPPDTVFVAVSIGVTEFEPEFTTYAVHAGPDAALAIGPLNPASPATTVPRATPTVKTRRGAQTSGAPAVSALPLARCARSIAFMAPSTMDDLTGAASSRRPSRHTIVTGCDRASARVPFRW